MNDGVNSEQIIIIELDDEKNDCLLEKEKLRTYIEEIAKDEAKGRICLNYFNVKYN